MPDDHHDRLPFADRADAGRRLALRLEGLAGDDPVVVGLPRGGVPVALEVALHLGAPLDVVLVRKLGFPFRPEMAMGAIGEDGVRILNQAAVRRARVTGVRLGEIERRERAELERRVRRFRGDRPRIPLQGRTVVVVDDGLATGSTARAGCQVVRALGASRVVLAVPVAPTGWTREFDGDADGFVCVATPEPFFAIGQWYLDFSQTTDEQVCACLDRAAARPATPSRDAHPGPAPAHPGRPPEGA